MPGHSTPRGSQRRLLRRDAERFGMGAAVVLGKDLAEAAGPVRHGACRFRLTTSRAACYLSRTW